VPLCNRPRILLVGTGDMSVATSHDIKKTNHFLWFNSSDDTTADFVSNLQAIILDQIDSTVFLVLVGGLVSGFPPSWQKGNLAVVINGIG
jgi:hypothetical protein